MNRTSATVTGETIMDSCPICTRSAYSPYRVYDERGKVLQGCVSAFHDGRLTPTSESARWHARPAAKAIRTALRRMRTGR